MSLCDRESFLEDMRNMDARDEIKEREKEEVEEEFQQLIDGDIKEIKYIKGNEIYEELYEEYSKEYDLKREENKWWGITIRNEEYE